MVYVQSIFVGLVAAILATVFVIIGGGIVSALSLAAQVAGSTGSGGIGAVSVGIPMAALIFAPLAFVAGFWWQLRRARRRSTG